MRDRLVLSSPVCVGERCDFGRVEQELDKGFDFSVIAAGELNAEVSSSFEIADRIFNSVNVSGGAFIIVLRNDIGDGSKVWSSLAAQPVQRANILLKEFVELISFCGG